MGQAIAFDTHAYVKKLESAGFTEKQAEVLASTQAELIEERLATKRDLKELETNLKKDITIEIEKSKAEIIKWNVGAVFTAVGLFAAIVKLLG